MQTTYFWQLPLYWTIERGPTRQNIYIIYWRDTCFITYSNNNTNLINLTRVSYYYSRDVIFNRGRSLVIALSLSIARWLLKVWLSASGTTCILWRQWRESYSNGFPWPCCWMHHRILYVTTGVLAGFSADLDDGYIPARRTTDCVLKITRPAQVDITTFILHM